MTHASPPRAGSNRRGRAGLLVLGARLRPLPGRAGAAGARAAREGPARRFLKREARADGPEGRDLRVATDERGSTKGLELFRWHRDASGRRPATTQDAEEEGRPVSNEAEALLAVAAADAELQRDYAA